MRNQNAPFKTVRNELKTQFSCLEDSNPVEIEALWHSLKINVFGEFYNPHYIMASQCHLFYQIALLSIFTPILNLFISCFFMQDVITNIFRLFEIPITFFILSLWIAVETDKKYERYEIITLKSLEKGKLFNFVHHIEFDWKS